MNNNQNPMQPSQPTVAPTAPQPAQPAQPAAQPTDAGVYGSPKTRKPLNKTVLIGLIVVVILTIAAIVSLIIINNNNSGTTSETETETTETIVEGDTSADGSAANSGATSAEQKITDSATIASLINKTWTLLSGMNAGSGSYSSSTVSEYTVGNALSTLSDTEKLGTAIAYSFINDHNSSLSDTISASEVETVYKKLFGTLPNHQNIHGNWCSGEFVYDASSKTYTNTAFGCGGTLQPVDYFYIYDITAQDDTAYVYLAVGSSDFDVDFNTATETTDSIKEKIYNDIHANAGRQLLQTLDENATFDGLNANNYDQFTKYRLVFNKDADNNYYYVNGEKI